MDRALKAIAEPIEVCWSALSRLVDYQRSLFSSIDDRSRSLFSETLRLLSMYQLDRLQAVYRLVRSGLPWDAELVLRPAYETMAKVLYIASQPTENRSTVLDEYWIVLARVYNRKGADKAARAEKLSRRFDKGDADIFRFLQRSDLFECSGPENKADRNAIEHRWSFSEIVRYLTAPPPGVARIDGLDAMLHIYGMASHLAHASSRALELMEDRAHRGGDLVPLQATHLCRIMSDIVSVACFSLHHCAKQLAVDHTWHDELSQIFGQMHSATKVHQEAFDETQREFYEGWRS